MSDTEKLRSQLEKEIGVCQSSDLHAHLDRGVVVIVDESLELIHAALAVAEDDADSVGHWIQTGKFVKPSLAQIDEWKASKELPFRSVIVRPYVLVQPLSADSSDA